MQRGALFVKGVNKSMTFKEALNSAKKHTWWNENGPGKLQYSYWMYSFVEQRKFYHPEYPSVAFCISDHGLAGDTTPSDERLKIYDWVKIHQENNPQYIYQLHDDALRMKQKALNEGEHAMYGLMQQSKEELLKSFHALKIAAQEYVCWGVFLECIDDYNSLVLPQKIREAVPKQTADECTSIMFTLATPRMVSFMEHFQQRKAATIHKHRNAVTTAQQFKDINDTHAKNDIRSIVKDYSWITVNYGGSNELNSEQLFEQLKQEATQETDAELQQYIASVGSKVERLTVQQDVLVKKLALPTTLCLDFEIIRSFGAWMDERKETMVRINEYLSHILQQLAAVSGVPKGEIEMYVDSEIDSLILQVKRIDSSTIQQRNGLVVYATEYDGEGGSILSTFTGDDAKLLAQHLRGEQNGQIVGIVASTGSVNDSTFTGTAQIVMDISKTTFTSGNILVTTMTRPEFVPLVKRATAVITDEGGITCHAAIISRELGIPCIIATKQATRRFKNGDTVVMNLKTGEVSAL